jgi:hypothetical protein
MRTLSWLFGEKKKPVRDAEAFQKGRMQQPDSQDLCSQHSCQEVRSSVTRNLR